MTGPEGRPASENVALLLSAAHVRLAIWVPTLALIVTGSIASLKVSFIVAPASTSLPSFSGLPSAAVMAVIRGMMIVVKLHCPAPTR